MTARDRARRLFKRISAGYALPTVNEIAEAILDAEREATERACRAVCAACRCGNPATKYGPHWIHLDSNDGFPCSANSIRKAAEEEPSHPDPNEVATPDVVADLQSGRW